MLSIFAIGLLGILFQILSLQPFHEICYDTSVWTEEKSYTLPVSKNITSSGFICFSPQFVPNALLQI